MRFENVHVPYGCYWSTPFVKWQGSLAQQHPVKLAAQVAKSAIDQRGISAESFDALFYGMSVPSQFSFYAAPWTASLIGNPNITGPIVMQACATSARLLASAAAEVEGGAARCILGITADKTSNGPHIYYPDPTGPGGMGMTENWVWDNFQEDPSCHAGPLLTAENVAREHRITKEEQDEVALIRYGQYMADRTDGMNRFGTRYMVAPLEIRDVSGRKVVATLLDDEGIPPTSAEGLARLKPVKEGGTVTFGTQTHPADGNCGLVIASREQAREMSLDPSISVQILSYGQSRCKPAYMPLAPVPAARAALETAGLTIDDMNAIKTHNPFAVNDVYFSREFDLAPEAFNNHGSSLVFGHPQGPTGMRLVIELIEELVDRGGGNGLFTGCAAGDTGAAVVVKVDCAALAR
jgi:acetyl-CoA acetyltransferase family protein